jgi:Zn finger protein HypA/HybF involved in hydrogenase expression
MTRIDSVILGEGNTATLYACPRCNGYTVGVNEWYGTTTGKTYEKKKGSKATAHDIVMDSYPKGDRFIKKTFNLDEYEIERDDVPKDHLIIKTEGEMRCTRCGGDIVHEIIESTRINVDPKSHEGVDSYSSSEFRIYCPSCNSDWTNFVKLKDMKYDYRGSDVKIPEPEEVNPFKKKTDG